MRETRFDSILIHARFDTEPPDVFVSISRRHTAQPCLLLLCPPELHLGIPMKNRDRSCATRSSAKATGTFIRLTTQHSQRVHLGPEQAIFLPGSFPCLSTYRSIPRATSRDREVAFHVIHLVSSWNSGLVRLGLAWLGTCLPDLPDPLKPSRSQRPKIGKRTAYEVHTDKRSAVSRRSTRRSAECNARYESGPSLKRLRRVLSVVSLSM